MKDFRRKATITAKYMNYSTDIDETHPKGTKFLSIDFDGHMEGRASPCNSNAEAMQVIDALIEQYCKKYKFEFIDLRNGEIDF